MPYQNSPAFTHDTPERIGVLLVNSGSPDSASTQDVRRFLGRLLGDPRVVELPRVLWLPILHGIILRTRPFRSARKYRRIWSERGSPLLAHSEDLRERVAARVGESVLAPTAIEIGMLYSRPGVSEALARLRDAGAQRILVVPLFPQYCSVSTGAVHDQVTDELSRWRWLPELRFISEYHEHPGYIDALRESVATHWAEHGPTRHLLMSFHGIPDKYFRKGDPYYCKCQKTARLLADELNLEEGSWSISFQSRYGPGNWLRPYTDEVLEALPTRGIRSVTVVCPGFSVDCLETLEEIDIENRERFLKAGGTEFQYVPALNAQPSHASVLSDLIVRNLLGWTPVNVAWLGVPAATR